jgi:hypothetical protein
MKEQLEFKWPGRNGSRSSTSQRRRNRCRWWFEQMRHAVEEAPHRKDSWDCATGEKRQAFENN